MMDHTSVLHTEDDLFYFETDHLALKGNKDYCEVLKTIVILTAQREKALINLSTVIQSKKKALEDPLAFMEKVKNNEDIGVPPMMEIPQLPKIDFSKYSAKVPEDDINSVYTTKRKETVEDIAQTKVSNDNKWTTEEQKKLEDLLLVYPPEPIERRRYEKIAKALGNRTVQQVCSRVQKYFLKLYKAGLPVPGRIPKSSEKNRKSLLHKHQRHNHYLWKPSTFFPELDVPVLMNDDTDNVPGPSGAPTVASTSSATANYLLPAYQETEPNSKAVVKNPIELQLELLNRIKQEKLKDREHFKHVGFRCDYCDEEPIVGTRWHCTTCTNSVDFCTDCVLSQLYSENCHPLSHKLSKYYGPNGASCSDSESYSGSAMSIDNKMNSDFSDGNSDDYESDQDSTLVQNIKYEMNEDSDSQ